MPDANGLLHRPRKHGLANAAGGLHNSPTTEGAERRVRSPAVGATICRSRRWAKTSAKRPNGRESGLGCGLWGNKNSGQKRSKPATLRGAPALLAAPAAGATFRQAAVAAGLSERTARRGRAKDPAVAAATTEAAAAASRTVAAAKAILASAARNRLADPEAHVTALEARARE